MYLRQPCDSCSGNRELHVPVNCSLVFSYVILSQAHASATKPWHMFSLYVLHMIVLLALVAATCLCKLFHRVILGDFVSGTCLCHNTLLHVLLVCIACDVVADTCRRNKSPHQNLSCLTTLKLTWALTIHKSHGLTLPKAWMDIGKSERIAGVSYVAISRVKTLTSCVIETMTYKRIMSLKSSANLQFRLQEENRLSNLAQATSSAYTETNHN